MILVRVGEQNDCEVAAPPGKRPAKPSESEFRVGSAVDEHCRPGRRDDEDRIPLTDVERREMEAPVRHGGKRGAGEQKGIDRQQADRTRGDPKESGAGNP